MDRRTRELLAALFWEKIYGIFGFILFFIMLGICIHRSAVIEEVIQLIVQFAAAVMLWNAEAFAEWATTRFIWTTRKTWTSPAWLVKIVGGILAISNFIVFLEGEGEKIYLN